ncbi:macro domain-like protein [Pleomassaria siparia CBS 279.74]|uniref:Macro domain-like protein n=1 Tax=Pleomassaria siparia CBS 279.74 TaxID=1314801 RepID=A0A6G1K6Y2_9PLEO|nr:macro domain-like protein [Pleomassaria siparia CBS 279.74]
MVQAPSAPPFNKHTMVGYLHTTTRASLFLLTSSALVSTHKIPTIYLGFTHNYCKHHRRIRTSTMSDPVPLSGIPTLSLLYKLNKISPFKEDSDSEEEGHVVSPPVPNATYNDKISVIRQDITTLAVDAIVNAANNSLLGGGGVDGAIHRAAGPDLYDECETLDGCATGSAKITDGYELPAKKVIHAVGPIYWSTKSKGKHTELLRGCYRTSLELCTEHKLKSIAFSALSTGVYGYPSGEASHVALDTVRKFLDEGKGDDIERIIFCNFMPKDEHAYFENIPKYFPPVVTEETTEGKSSDELDLAARLPDAPTTEPKSPEAAQPSPKKQKTEATEEDFVVIDKEEVKEAKEAEAKTAIALKADQ